MSPTTLADRLRALFPDASGRSLKQWLETGRVTVDGRACRDGRLAVAAGAVVTLGGRASAPFPRGLTLVHEDDAILVVVKPAGLLTIATERERERTAYRLLRDWVATRSARASLFIVHRLDRETSGLIVFAKSVQAKQHLQAQFAARTAERVYVALVEGVVRQAEGSLISRLVEDRTLRVRIAERGGGKEAITRYRVLEHRRGATLLELRLVTGRRAQIRAQLAAAGHPIAGDARYGGRTDPMRRLALHATRLAFLHPRGGRLSFDSPLPPPFGRRT